MEQRATQTPPARQASGYPYGYCGMPCALCTRYRTAGKSRCTGCSQDGYYTDVCKVHHCVRAQGLLHCGTCAQFPCQRLGKMSDFRDLNTDQVKMRTCRRIAAEGIDAWRAEYEERARLLDIALARYNNGRMKRYLCELFILQEIVKLREIMAKAAPITGTPKEAGAAFAALVAEITGT